MTTNYNEFLHALYQWDDLYETILSLGFGKYYSYVASHDVLTLEDDSSHIEGHMWPIMWESLQVLPRELMYVSNDGHQERFDLSTICKRIPGTGAVTDPLICPVDMQKRVKDNKIPLHQFQNIIHLFAGPFEEDCETDNLQDIQIIDRRIMEVYVGGNDLKKNNLLQDDEGGITGEYGDNYMTITKYDSYYEVTIFFTMSLQKCNALQKYI
jgi:hypothetical protein